MPADLPESFLNDMKELLGADDYSRFLQSLAQKPFSGLRVNTMKTEPGRILSRFGNLRKIPWTDNGFYISEESRFTRHPYYYAGLYYIQEPSAMTPASLLGTVPGERILDLCAAPGGKTTEIGARLQGRGVLYANDLSSSRAKALLKNIELFGIGNAVITTEDSGKLLPCFPEYFDRILIDAPCSGEGMFRKHPAVLRAYLEHGRDFYCPVQQKLLDDASQMLKPGGTLLYSTCTYNRREDEDQIARFLGTHPDFAVDPLPAKEGFTMSRLLPGCVRLFPYNADAEGHFAARLKKKDSGTGGPFYPAFSCRQEAAGRTEREDLKSAADFLARSGRPFDPSRISAVNGYVTYFPENAEIPSGLRYLRTGLLLGQTRNGRFRPSQALAMNLTAAEWQNPVLLAADDSRVIRYLKGETVETDADGEDGFRLLCADGFPLGFVKQEGSRFKNMYLPGWRWM